MKRLKKLLIRIPVFSLLVFILILVYTQQVEPKCIRVRELTITDPDIPEEFDGFKIIFFSDVHCGKFFSVKQVQKLVKKVNDREPDLIIMGGDYTGDYHPRHGFKRVLRNIFVIPFYGHANSKEFVEPFFNEVKNLKAEHGVFGVMGNHDYWHGAEDLSKQGFKDAGIKHLDNEGYWITKGDTRIKIGGVSDAWVRDDQILEPTINDAETDDFVILVSHNPEFVKRIKTEKIDLVLAGHTHRAQFGLEPYFRKKEKRKRYFYGLVKDPNTTVYITSGIGTILFPVRLFAPPEIVEITLKTTLN